MVDREHRIWWMKNPGYIVGRELRIWWIDDHRIWWIEDSGYCGLISPSKDSVVFKNKFCPYSNLLNFFFFLFVAWVLKKIILIHSYSYTYHNTMKLLFKYYQFCFALVASTSFNKCFLYAHLVLLFNHSYECIKIIK